MEPIVNQQNAWILRKEAHHWPLIMNSQFRAEGRTLIRCRSSDFRFAAFNLLVSNEYSLILSSYLLLSTSNFAIVRCPQIPELTPPHVNFSLNVTDRFPLLLICITKFPSRIRA
jgi:hypothetical protein